MFDPDANSVLLRAHLCTAVDFMRRKPWVRNCSRERKGLYNGNVQQNPLCAASCFTKDIPSLPGSRLRFFIAGQIQHRKVHRFYTLQPKLMLSDSVGLVPVFEFQEPRGSGVDEALVVGPLQGRCLKNYAIHRRRNRTYAVLKEMNP